ncbi:MAG: hypothetical protein HY365_02595 [Candidatus Aenigmarchaeota archaeon]|nr:hypothetical protein [Candidatus Aenigmarchaeota archaeon]
MEKKDITLEGVRNRADLGNILEALDRYPPFEVELAVNGYVGYQLGRAQGYLGSIKTMDPRRVAHLESTGRIAALNTVRETYQRLSDTLRDNGLEGYMRAVEQMELDALNTAMAPFRENE